MKDIELKSVDEEDVQFTFDLYQLRDKREKAETITLESQKTFIKNYVNDKSVFESWVIVYVDKEKAGTLSLRHSNGELGYYFLPKFQNKGIASISMKKFLKINPKEYYTVIVDNYNTHSMHFIEKLGFNRNGIQYKIESENIPTDIQNEE
jgi:RimJ/RimL family protein N-acetyltransferase